MDEIGKKDILEIGLEDGSIIFGHVNEYSKDRISVKIDDDSIEVAKKLKELDKLHVLARTRYGIKNMVSHVIYEMNNANRIVIENASTDIIEQRREYVRAVDSFEFEIFIDNKKYSATCLDVSAGGMAFSSKDNVFEKDQIVQIVFDESIFSKKIVCEAQVIKVRQDFCSIKFLNLNVYDESRIAKRVFAILSGK